MNKLNNHLIQQKLNTVCIAHKFNLTVESLVDLAVHKQSRSANSIYQQYYILS